MYEAAEEDIINYRRGAIVELLTHELINSRCSDGECLSHQCLSNIDGTYISKQVDVVVLSEKKQQIEGYSCKVKVISADCSGLRDLIDLSEEAKELGYNAHIGLVSLDDSFRIQQRLKTCSRPDAPSIQVPYLPEKIRAYGLDNLSDLMRSPFR